MFNRLRGARQQHEHISQHNREILHEERILGGGEEKIGHKNSLWRQTFGKCLLFSVKTTSHDILMKAKSRYKRKYF